MEHNLTTGNVFKTIVVFAAPYLLSYFLQTLYGMADLFIIGQYASVDAITAVANGGQVMNIITVVIVGLAMGTTVIVGHAIGARKLDRAATVIGNAVTLFMGVAAVLTVCLFGASEALVRLIDTPSEAVDGTTVYLSICIAGIPFVTGYNVVSAIFRGLGDSKSPMYFIGIACVANIALDYLFIGYMGIGPAGAALGTTCAQALSLVCALLSIRGRKTGIHLARADFKPRADVLKSMLAVGLPIAVQDGFIQVAFIFITVIANGRGITDAAAVGVVEKIIGTVFIVPSSMLATVSALTAQNAGAGKPERARQTLRYALLITTGYGIAVAAIMQPLAPAAVALFTSDAQAIVLGAEYLRSYILDTAIAGAHFCFSGYFAAYGRSYIGFAHNLAAIALVRIPGSWFLSNAFPNTLYPMGLASPAGSVLSVVICLAAYTLLNRRGAFEKLAAA